MARPRLSAGNARPTRSWPTCCSTTSAGSDHMEPPRFHLIGNALHRAPRPKSTFRPADSSRTECALRNAGLERGAEKGAHGALVHRRWRYFHAVTLQHVVEAMAQHRLGEAARLVVE